MDRKESDKSKSKAQTAIELTSFIMHKHYCENDVESIIDLFDDRFSWLGAGEQEYILGRSEVEEAFRRFAERVPRCIISDEHYDALEISPEAYLCTGKCMIAAEPSTGFCMQVHQRVSMIFRWVEGKPRCCHIHVSNPYEEMADEDEGFPMKMAKQTHDYLQQCIEQQKKQIASQATELESIYNTIPCFIMRLLKTENGYQMITFNRALTEMLGYSEEEIRNMDWFEGVSFLVEKDDRKKLKDSLEKLKKPGDRQAVDYRLRKRNGDVIYLSGSSTLISEEKYGKVVQRISFDISKRVELEKILKQMSFEDSLTGMYNRNRLNYDMGNCTVNTEKKLGVVGIDINGLKAVNDMNGHYAGDELICHTARNILKCFSGKCYRIGGDEFVIIEENVEKETLKNELQNLRALMEEDNISISAGYSWRPSGGVIEEQIREADRNMYEDKAKYYSRRENDRRKR